MADAEYELVLNEWHPRVIVEFYHGARIEEVEVADLRGENGETIALRFSKGLFKKQKRSLPIPLVGI